MNEIVLVGSDGRNRIKIPWETVLNGHLENAVYSVGGPRARGVTIDLDSIRRPFG